MPEQVFQKSVMYEFWYDYMKPKDGEEAKFCYMDTDSFIVYIKPEDIYPDITRDVRTRFNTSNYKLDRPLPKIKNKKGIDLMKGKLGGNNNTEDNKVKDTKKCVVERKLKFEDYNHCLEGSQLGTKRNQFLK